jgi:hypothetical protein
LVERSAVNRMVTGSSPVPGVIHAGSRRRDPALFSTGLGERSPGPVRFSPTFRRPSTLDVRASRVDSVRAESAAGVKERATRARGTPFDTPPIDPLSREPQHALNWENLYLSCPTSETCDDAKEGHRLARDPADPSLPWPTQQAYENWVGFTSGGEIFVRSDAPTPEQRRALQLAIDDRDDGSQLRRSILNLNQAALVAARKAAIDSEKSRLDREYRGRRAPPVDRAGLATAMLQRVQCPAFVSVRVAHLHRTLGRGRP